MICFYTALALLLAFLIDMLIGDPYRFPHPVRFFGLLISFGTKRLNNPKLGSRALFWRGAALSVCVVVIAWALSALLLLLCAKVHFWLWFAAETTLCWTVFAAKSLKTEGKKIYKTMKREDIQLARQQLSMIVGRDTENLTKQEIIKAVVETIAENTTDGVAAPMLYAAACGAPLGLAYKAANTLDSMIGYKNEKYLHFGRFAAKADDVWNFIPARITAVFMIAAAFLTGLDAKSAARIYIRDRKKHASPNSAQTESVCAGALGVALAGDANYFGTRVKKPSIGDKTREIEPEDILRACRLMTATSLLLLAAVFLIKLALIGAVCGVLK